MFNKPSQVIEMLELEPNMVVADFGAGSGFYTLEAAKLLNKGGKVYAIDVQKDLLGRLKNQAKALMISNVEAIWADIEKIGGTKIRDKSCDAVIIANVLFIVPDKKSMILEAKRILKPKGKLLVIDWTDSFGGMGPQAEHVFGVHDAEKLLTENGYIFERQVPAGDHHYGLIFRSS